MVLPGPVLKLGLLLAKPPELSKQSVDLTLELRRVRALQRQLELLSFHWRQNATLEKALAGGTRFVVALTSRAPRRSLAASLRIGRKRLSCKQSNG